MSASSAPGLPHDHPFVFVDRVLGEEAEEAGSVRMTLLRVTAGGCPDGGGTLPATLSPTTLLLEAMAQSALALLSADSREVENGEEREPRRGALVGIDEASFDDSLARRPPAPGDTLVGSCEVRGRFGPMVKVGASLERDGVRIASAELLLTAQ